jgi:hypothetical protein
MEGRDGESGVSVRLVRGGDPIGGGGLAMAHEIEETAERPRAQRVGQRLGTSRRILVDPDRWLRGPLPEADVGVLHDAVFADRRLRIR